MARDTHPRTTSDKSPKASDAQATNKDTKAAVAGKGSSTKSRRIALVVMAVSAALVLVCAISLLVTSKASSSSATQDGSNSSAKNGSASSGGSSNGIDADSIAPRQTDPNLLKFKNSTIRHQADDPRAQGQLDAPVTILQYSDFSCPMCFQFELNQRKQLQKLVDDGVVRFEWHDLLIFDEQWNSSLGARAGYAASLQGKFWEFVEAAAQHGTKQGQQNGESHIDWTEQIAKQLAQQAGISNIDRFVSDMSADSTLKAVDQDAQNSHQFGFEGTPSFFINDRVLVGAQPVEVFNAVIEAAKTEKSGSKKS